MKSVSGWIRAAAVRLQPPARRANTTETDSEDEFIYNRVAAQSDDEGDGASRPNHKYPKSAEAAAADAAAADASSPSAERVSNLHAPLDSFSGLAAAQSTHSTAAAPSAGTIPDTTSAQTVLPTATTAAATNSSRQAAEAANGGGAGRSGASSQREVEPAPAAATSPKHGSEAAGASSSAPAAAAAASTGSAGAGTSTGKLPLPRDSSSSGAGAGAAANGTTDQDNDGTLDAAALAEEQQLEAAGAAADLPEELVGCGPERELYIYALPLQRGKVIYLPVVPWRAAPQDNNQAAGLTGAVNSHVRRMQGEVSDLWARMSAAEQGTFAHRMYKFGKRMLDAIPAEERLMRGIPKHISRVIIYHPSSVQPTDIMSDMTTMTKAYGITAMGKAAAATVMLPLAVGIDLIILPGPQVLTYYSLWQIYRNTNGAVGTSRMTRFITQGGNSKHIQVHYAPEPKLDHYFELVQELPEGVLPEEEIEALVRDLDQPELLEPLLSLRAKSLREAKRTSWSNNLGLGGRTSSGEEYLKLPAEELQGDVQEAFRRSSSSGGGGGSGGGARGSRRVSGSSGDVVTGGTQPLSP